MSLHRRLKEAREVTFLCLCSLCSLLCIFPCCADCDPVRPSINGQASATQCASTFSAKYTYQVSSGSSEPVGSVTVSTNAAGVTCSVTPDPTCECLQHLPPYHVVIAAGSQSPRRTVLICASAFC
jgi:hypothetical protein